MHDDTDHPDVTRLDRYTITVNGARIRATADQEARIRHMTREQADRLTAILGHRP